MQYKLPYFPSAAKYINSSLAYWSEDAFAYYMFSGSVFYCHKIDDRKGYKVAIGMVVTHQLSRISELVKSLGEPRKNIERYAKAYKEHGISYFFNREDGRGQCYKYTPSLVAQVQAMLDEGKSMYRISKELTISASSITYHLKKGTLRSKVQQHDNSAAPCGSTPFERAKENCDASHGQGMAVTFQEERLSCSLGSLTVSPVQFQACQSIPMGGVMLLLPFLIACGLESYKDYYQQREKGFYSFDCLFITMAFMYLCRIKNFEKMKHQNVGDWGKMIGYDRAPEVKKLRGLTNEITEQKKCGEWSASLAERWIGEDAPELFYVDGHVQVYHGYLANPGLKHVSRERLCLPGMMEFWVNSSTGMPFFFVTASVNEKMIEMLKDQIIPQLLKVYPISEELQLKMDQNALYPRLTLVFDREGFSPEFFSLLWEQRIAVITYRKNVKDTWNEDLFQETEVATTIDKVKMKLHQEDLLLTSNKKSYKLKEVRKLCKDGHQTSIVTTNWVLSLGQIAAYMFSRWWQENFFRFMRQEYAMDALTKYSKNEVDDNMKVVNREYTKVTYRIKTAREKLKIKKVQLQEHSEESPKDLGEEDKVMQEWMTKQFELKEEETKIKQDIEKLIQKRKGIPEKIKVSEMPKEARYTKTDQESKHLHNCVKMICYRAETSLAQALAPHFSRANDEIRALVQSVIKTTIDLYPDYVKNELVVKLYPLSNRRSMEAVQKILEVVNKTRTKYPGTELVLFYEFATF